MIRIIIILLVSMLLSCAETKVPRARSFVSNNLGSSDVVVGETEVSYSSVSFTDAQCYSLMKSRDHWMFTAKLLGGVGGLGALAAPPFEDNTIQWSIAASAATLGVAGIAAAWVGDSKSNEFEKFCILEP